MGDEDDLETWERDQLAQDDEGDFGAYESAGDTCQIHGCYLECAPGEVYSIETSRCTLCEADDAALKSP